ncbi:MAG: carboxypeptidase-like regulatory domain-containing protein [Fimbriimonadaceae bacterium]
MTNTRDRFRRCLFPLALPLGVLLCGVPIVVAQQPPTTQKPQLASNPAFRKGVLYGRVLDLNGKPVPGATVAVLAKDGKVLAWTSTNALGEYALAADPLQALNLRPSRRRGLLEACARAVGDLAMAPVKVVGGAVANPGKTLGAGVVSVASGTPAPLAAQVALGLPGIGRPAETARQARELAARTAVGGGHGPLKSNGVEGEAMLLVGATGCKDARAPAGAYWMEGPILNKESPMGMQAWLETVKMAPTAGDKKSEVEHDALTLCEPVVDPTLAAAGASVKIQVKLKSPPGPEHSVRVFARERRKDVVVELTPKAGADKSLYGGTLVLDPKTPAGETTISIGALRRVPVEVKLDPKKADPLILFVARLDDMQAGKPYQYDPRIMASENRLDIKITVLEPTKGTPPTK